MNLRTYLIDHPLSFLCFSTKNVLARDAFARTFVVLIFI